MGRRTNGEGKGEKGQPRGGQHQTRPPARPGGPHGEEEQGAVDEDEAGRGPGGSGDHELRRVRHQGHVGAQEAAHGLGQPRHHLGQMLRHGLLSSRDAHDARRCTVRRRAHPPRAARGEQGHEREPEHAAAPTGSPDQVKGDRGHDARGHEMRPKGEARQKAEERETGAGLLARPQGGSDAQAQQEQEAAQDQGGRVEGRRQNRHQQEVGRRAGHEHRRGQRRRIVERLRDTVGEGNQGEAEEKDRETQRFGGGPHRRHEGRGDPGVEGRPVGLPPEGDPPPEVAGHEADDRGVAIDRSAEGLDPEGHAHDHAQQDGGGQAPARALHRSAASSPGAVPPSGPAPGA